MTYYSLIVNVHGEDGYETVPLSGMQSLAAAAQYLDKLAQSGEIEGINKVNVYDVITISDTQLKGLLEFLKIDSSIYERGNSFDVDLFES